MSIIPQFKNKERRTSLLKYWLRFHAPNAGGWSSIPSQGTGPHMLQLERKSLSAATETAAAKQVTLKKKQKVSNLQTGNRPEQTAYQRSTDNKAACQKPFNIICHSVQSDSLRP